MKKAKLALWALIGSFGLGFIALAGVFFIVTHTFFAQTIILIGAIDSQRGSGVEMGFKLYIESEQDIQGQYYLLGEEVIAKAGYSYSAKKYIFHNLLQTCSSTKIIFLCSMVLLFGVGGKCFQIVVMEISNSETNYCNSQREATALENEMEKKFREIDEYEENLYHQLKTAITSLQLCFDQLVLQNESSAETTVHFEVQMQLQKLSRLVTLFLRDRKLANNMVKFNYRLAELDEIVDSAIAQLNHYAVYNHILLRSIKADNEYYIHCDSNWISECIVTLIENSIDHSLPNKEVLVTMHHREKSQVIAIQSFGKSLSNEELETVFGRFHSTKAGHFGIGLHMAKTVVENHHGTILIRNNVDGEGVTFEVVLPMIDRPIIYD